MKKEIVMKKETVMKKVILILALLCLSFPADARVVKRRYFHYHGYTPHYHYAPPVVAPNYYGGYSWVQPYYPCGHWIMY